jgi:mono/diheme cytochrome c family protein
MSVIAAVLAVWTSSALAAEVERGRKFAYRVCSLCHQVSPNMPPGVPPAPAFASIAKSKQFRAKQATFLGERHATMPHLALDADDAADLAAYIRSLARRHPAAVPAVRTSSALAAEVERGRKFAYRVCSLCHQVSPNMPPGVPPAPAFASIAKSKQFRAKQATFLGERHATMPHLALDADDAADLAAYIRSLARRHPARK